MRAQVGRYAIVRPLGSGGMGDVFLARDPELGRLVAVKLLRGEEASDPRARERLRREAQSLAALNHPAIVTIYEIGHEGDLDFIAMEYTGGRSLRRVLEEGDTSLGDRLALCARVAHALDAAHGAGVLHRDVKPENVMVGTGGAVKVVDFGLARRIDHGHTPARGTRLPPGGDLADVLTRSIRMRASRAGSGPTGPFDSRGTDTVYGTPAYMAPEQLRGDESSRATDVHGLAILLYEVIAGRRPFDAADLPALLRLIGDPARSVPPLAGAPVPARLADLLVRALAYEPGDRPTMRELARALEQAAALAAPAAAGGMADAGRGASPTDAADSAPPAADVQFLSTQPALSAPNPLSSGAPGDPAFAALPRPRSPALRLALLAPAGLIAAALTAGALWFFGGRDGGAPETRVSTAAVTPPPPPGSIALVIPPAEITVHSIRYPPTIGAADLLSTYLKRVPAFRMIDVEHLLAAVGPTAVEGDYERVAAELGAAFVGRLRLWEEAGRLRGSFEVTDVTRGRTVVARASAEAPLGEIDPVLRGIARGVVAELAPGATIETTGPARSMETVSRYEAALSRLHAGAWTEAAARLEGAVATEPSFFEAWYHLALARAWAAAPLSAVVEAADRAKALAPTDREADLMRAVGHFVRRDFVGALPILEGLRDRFPRDRDVLYLLAECHYHDGRHAEGLGLFRLTLEISPNFHMAAVHPMLHAISTADRARMEMYDAILSGGPGSGGGAGSDLRHLEMELALGRWNEVAALEAMPHRAYALGLLGRRREAVAALAAAGGFRNRLHVLALQLASGRAAEARSLLAGLFADVREPKGSSLPEFDYELLGEVLVAAERGDDLAALLELWDNLKDAPPDRRWTIEVHAARLLGRPELASRPGLPWRLRRSGEAVLADLSGDRGAAASIWAELLADPGEHGDWLARLAHVRVLAASGETEALRAACAGVLAPHVVRPVTWLAIAACKGMAARKK